MTETKHTKLPEILKVDGRRIMWGIILVAETAHADWQSEDMIPIEQEGLAIAAELVTRYNQHSALLAVAEAAESYFASKAHYNKFESNQNADTMGMCEDFLRLKLETLAKLREGVRE